MEEIRDPKIEEFLRIPNNIGSGWGSGEGSGLGEGWGWGWGSGSGWGLDEGEGSGEGLGSGEGWGEGWGEGSGEGSGWGSGWGSGDGIDSVDGKKIYSVDGFNTVITKVMGNAAKGAIFNRDFTLTPCYIAKRGRFFAHGSTLREAVAAATAKEMQNMSEEDRIQAFVTAHPENAIYPVSDFFTWHNTLTGSCEAGRKAFARDHGIDLEGSMSVLTFIELTENSYGGSTIKKLRPYYE